MNLRFYRDRSVVDLGGCAERLSERIAYYIAPIMQTIGVSEIRISHSDSMHGSEPFTKSVSFFPDVPECVSRWSESAVQHIGRLMSVFGIRSISVYPGSSKDDVSVQGQNFESDLENLSYVWKSIATGEGPVKKIDIVPQREEDFLKETGVYVPENEDSHAKRPAAKEDTGTIVL